MKGYYQLVEGHTTGFMFVLRAGNHETIFESRVYWSRTAALEAVQAMRAFVPEPSRLRRHETASGTHYFEWLDADGHVLGRSSDCASRAGLSANIASVQRNAPSLTFRGLVRRALDGV